MGNSTAKESFEEFVITYKSFNDMKLLALYDYFDPTGAGKIQKNSLNKILEECLNIYLERMKKEVSAHPFMYSKDGYKLVVKKIQDKNYQTTVLKDNFPNDEVTFEEFRKWLEVCFDEHNKLLWKKKKGRTASVGEKLKFEESTEPNKTAKRGSVIMEFGKSLNNFARRGSMAISKGGQTPDTGSRKSSLTGLLFQEKEEIYNFYDHPKEGVFTTNDKLPRYHFTSEELFSMNDKISTLHCVNSYLYVGTTTGEIICYEISEVQTNDSLSLNKIEISKYQTKEKQPIIKIETDENCSLLFFLSNDCVTMLHFKTLILKNDYNEDENNKGAYSFIEKGVISGGLRSGSLTLFTLDKTRDHEGGLHRIAIFGNKSKNIDVYEYATVKLKPILNLVLIGSYSAIFSISSLFLCQKYLIFTNEASKEEYFINTIGEDVVVINSKVAWPKAKDKMKNPQIEFIAVRTNHKNAFTVLVKSHHYVLPAFLQLGSGNKLIPYVENYKQHFSAKYSDMKFVHEPEEMAVCFPFVAGSIDSSKGITKCIEFKNVFNPRSTAPKDRNNFKSIRDPTPIRLSSKCSILVASKERFYYVVDNKVFFIAVPPIIQQLDHLKQDELFDRYSKLKEVRASAIYQIFRVDLIKVMNRSTETGKVPRKIQQLIDFLMIHAPDVKGIFRVPGTKAEVDKVIDLIDLGEEIPFEKYTKDVNDIGSAFKQYVRELPIPILTYEKFDDFLNVSNLDSNEEKLELLKKLTAEIPKPNQYLLFELLKLCKKIEEKSTSNMMTNENLAVVFGIGVLKPQDEMKQIMCVNGIQSVFVSMLNLFPDFFPQEEIQKELSEEEHISNSEEKIKEEDILNGETVNLEVKEQTKVETIELVEVIEESIDIQQDSMIEIEETTENLDAIEKVITEEIDLKVETQVVSETIEGVTVESVKDEVQIQITETKEISDEIETEVNENIKVVVQESTEIIPQEDVETSSPKVDESLNSLKENQEIVLEESIDVLTTEEIVSEQPKDSPEATETLNGMTEEENELSEELRAIQFETTSNCLKEQPKDVVLDEVQSEVEKEIDEDPQETIELQTTIEEILNE
eukprot:gene8831-779_t